jgi:hypothetical protein
MSNPKLPPLPAILIANDLQTGDIVLASADGWTRNPANARLATRPDEAEALLTFGTNAMGRNVVVDAYLVDVALRKDGVPVPRHFRERFRILGPSNRPDLGKQADFPGLALRAHSEV